ncbi:MAG TPA: hypothetical protein VF181_07780 [Balneolaceae bacterium]
MPGEDKRYTADFKKEVAQKALDQSKKDLDGLSKEHDVPVSVILIWATELEKGGPDVFETTGDDDAFIEEPGTMDLEIRNEEVAESVDYGAMFDKLNYKRLIFWSVFGLALIAIFVQALLEMYQYNVQTLEDRVVGEGEFYEVNRLKQDAREQLNTFGVVDLEEGIYRIPIDSAISDIADNLE